MLVVVDLEISTALILHSVEESVAVHVDIRLLPEKALAVTSKSIKEVIVHLHHLLLLESVTFFLEILNSLKRRLSYRYISG